MAVTDSANGALGKYQLIAELGHGGMAQVFLALASGPAGFNKLVVIKQIRAQFAEDPEFLSMFLDEARLAARLNHPNVVQTNEVGEDDGRYFICMEYLEGQPLNRVLTRLGSDKVDPVDRLNLRQQLQILVDTLSGLHHAHELCDFDGTPLQVVHRDMSPHNVFVTYAGQVKVVDFGIAKALSSSSETRTGVLKGKIGYMAPEQAMGEKVDRRADIFSVGMILWEMLTGRRMFKGVPDVAVLQKIVNGDIPSPREVAPHVPERLEAITMKALARRREDRYATAVDFAADVEDVMSGLTGRGTLRDLGKVLERQFESDRSRIKALVEASHAGTQTFAEVTADVRRTGSGPRARPLPVIDTPMTESISTRRELAPAEAPTTVESGTGGNRPSPSSLTATATANTSADAPPAPPQKSRTMVMAGGAVAVGAALAVAFLATRGHQEPPKPAVASTASATAEAAPARTMRIESSPAGASVSEGATVLGKTPLELPLDPAAGTRHLVVSLDGYMPYAVTQEPSKDNVRVVVPLAPAPQAAPAKASAEPSAEPKAKPTPPPRAPVTPPPAPPAKPPPAGGDINMTR
jgi:serine/threonine-protein kinase